MKLSSNKNTSLLLLIVLVAALLFAVYYYIVLPKIDNVVSIEGSINALQTEITTLEGQMSSMDEQAAIEVENIFTIRQKLPKSREIDQLLLNLEEIEFVSEARITSIGFNSYDTLVSESAIAPTPEEEIVSEEDTAEEPAIEGETEGTEAEEVAETPVSDIAAETLPPELKLITFNLELEVPEYQSLQSFIKELEKLPRIMHVDTISFTLPGEEGEFMEDVAESLNASIQVTTFYYEGES
ncbi:potassium transporter [Ureibacillus chungkukjangi]|uniref:potassium transporter n=1 Tax=Ureibacillus chungkukjangi TaxID=1202712 RepID=UPI00384F9FF6